MTVAYVGFGANQGDARATFDRAASAIAALPGVATVRRSSLWESAPVGVTDQPWFLNGCFGFDTTSPPRELLEGLFAVEARLGRDRRREVPGGPRTCDLDVLIYGDRVIEEPGLIVPHPRMHERAFVLAPLVELAGRALSVPGRGTAGELYDRVYTFETCRRAGRSD